MTASADIQQTLHRLAWGTDLRRIDYIEACYTPEARFTVTGDKGRVVEGRDAILQGIESTWSKTPPSIGHHLITNSLVERESDTDADVVSYKTVVRVVDGKPTIVSSGWYRDHLVKEGDVWLIDDRALTNDAQV
jgi:SnoaL-like domain